MVMITTWFLFCRETTNTYTIDAPPVFGYLGPSTRKYSVDGDLKLPFISDKLETIKSPRRHLFGSVRDEDLSFQYTGGCSLTQTVFNGTANIDSINNLLTVELI